MLQKRWIGAVLAVSLGLGSILNPLLISGTAVQNGLSRVNTTRSGVTVAPESIQPPIKNRNVEQDNRTVSKPKETIAGNSTASNQTWKFRSAGTMNQSGTGTNSTNARITTITNHTGTATGLSNSQFQILVRAINAEAGGEPFEGQVAVAAVLLNRIRSGRFPKTISANVFRNGEFESVSNGYIWDTEPTTSAYRAATLAVKGWDPTGGALYFYNPAKSSSAWIWSRPIYTKIGNHYFAG